MERLRLIPTLISAAMVLSTQLSAAEEGTAESAIPKASKASIDELMGPLPPASSLPPSSISTAPRQSPVAPRAPAAANDHAPSLSVRDSTLPPTRTTAAVPPAPDLGDIPEPPPAPTTEKAAARPAFAHGVVLERAGTQVLLIGDRGFIHTYQLPKRGHLISLTDGGLVEVDEVASGDFVALVGTEEGTNLPILAYLKLGQQPSGRYADMAESIEGCYQQAVAELERRKAP